jgi:putative addiction module killer protein
MRDGNSSNAKGVGGGVVEWKVDFGPGYRIYFGRDGDEIIVLLGGGTKRRQQQDIGRAITWWLDYKKRRSMRWR